MIINSSLFFKTGIESVDGILFTIVEKIVKPFSWNIKAILVVGSLATGEYSPPIDDVDLIVITTFYDPFMKQRIESIIHHIPFELDIGQVTFSRFKRSNNQQIIDAIGIGKVIYGNEEITKIRRLNPSSIYRYDGMKLFFNYGIMRLISCISKEIFEAPKLTEEQERNIQYNCIKAYEGICGSLLILRKKYVIGHKRRAEYFLQNFNQEFPEISRHMPNLVKKIDLTLKYRNNLPIDYGDPREMWFNTREDVWKVLPFILNEYFPKTFKLNFKNIVLLNKFPHNFLNSILYFFRLFINYNIFAPFESFIIEPVIKVHIVGACILFSVNKSLQINRVLLKFAKNNLEKIYPISSDVQTIKSWERLRNICSELNEKSIVSQLHLNSDIY